MEPTFTRLARLFVSLLFLCSLELYSQIGPGIAPVNLPSGGFNIDGTLLSNSTNGDWVDGTGSGGFVLANSGTPLNTKTTYHLYDEYNSGTDDIFGGGDKVSDNPNSMTWSVGTANNKTDMNNALIHFTTDANGNVWFVFAADRLSNSGNAYIDFEFLQDGLTKTATGFSTTASNSTGGRSQGDFLLTVYFESGVAKFDIQRWTLVSGVWQYKTYYSSLPVNSVYAAGNSSIIPVPYSAFGTNSYPENTFIESAVNLTEVLSAIDPCASLKIKTIFVKSKTSTAPSASIKDFFEPLPVTNLTLGSADAGDDDTVCSGGSYKLQGVAVPSSNYSVVSTTWSVISGNATIATPSALDSYVTVNGGSATLRLTVETHSGSGTHCIVYDEVTITSIPSPSCLITGTDGPICPSTESSFSAPSSASYLWDISGNGTISGSTTSQTVTLTTGSTCNASFTLTLNTTDANGCTSTCTKTVVVNDTTAPVVTTSSGALDHNIQCSDTAAIASALTEVPTATDICSTTPTIHLVSDVTTPTTNCTNGYSRVRTWNFTDGCGNTSANFVQTITVIDNIVPTWTTGVGSLNTTVECSDTQALANAQNLFPIASDNCDADVSNIVKVAGTFVAASTCTNAGTYTNTWTVTDECGNSSEAFTQVINVIDNTAPTWTTAVGSLNTTVQCSDTQALANAQNLFPIASDNCDTNLSNIVKVAGTFVAAATCANAGTYTNTWTVTDECGNSSEAFTQVINVIDNTAPTWTTAVGSLNTTVQCSDTQALANAQNLFPIASDNCDTNLSNIVKVAGTFVASATCANAGTYTNTWTVTDECGNSSEVFTQVINVIDDTVPTWTTAVGSLNTTVQCSDTQALVDAQNLFPIASDNCDANVSNIVKVAGTFVAAATCTNAGTYTNTWTVTDECGNVSEAFTQVINVIDTTVPTWTTAVGSLNTTVECSDTQALADAQNLFPVATDNCDADLSNIVKVSGTFVASATCANAGTYTNTWTVTDECGNVSEVFTQVINVIDDTAPTFIAPADITLSSGTNCYADISTAITGEVTGIQDNCDFNATASFIDSDCFGNFNSASINSGTGNYFPFTVSGFDNVSANAIKKVALAFETNQGKGRSEFVLVAPNGQGIILVAPYCNGGDCDNLTSNEKELYLPEFYPNNSNYPKWDNTNPIATNSIQNFTPNGALSTSNSITGLNSLVSSFEEFTGNLNGNWFIFARKDGTEEGKIEFKSVCLNPSANLCGNNKVIVRKWSVSDACSNTIAFNQIIKIIDTTAPTWTTAIGSLNTTVECSDTQALADAQNLFPIASDNCDADLSNIVKVAGTFVASATCANAGTYTNTWTVTDDCGNVSEVFTQVINVIDTTAPTWTTAVGSLNTTVECSNTQALANAQNLFPIATDNCDADLSNIVKVTGTFVASTTCANAGAYTNTWTVTDECGNISEAFTQIINVIDTTVPTWTTAVGSLNTTVECSDTQALANAQNLFPIATDNCDADLSNIIKVAGTFVASATCANAGTYTNTWTVTDDCDNSSEAYTQTITIQDTTVPDIATKATDIIVECDGQGNQNAIANWLANNGGAIAFDNCSEIIWTNNFNSIANDCSTAVTVVFTATDACGNSASTSAIFSVQDNTPPVVPVAPATITVGCASDIPVMITLTASDNCSGNITVEGTNSIELGDCENTYTINRTWTFTDACNNISSTSQIIHVIDTTPPTIAPLPELSTIACPNTPVFTQAIATDECGSNVNLTFNDVKTEGSCAGSYSITRNWTATDMCGNSTTASQTINVEDKVAPVIASLPEPTTITCTNSPVFAFATATDECGSDFNLTFKDVKTEGSCAGSYSITRTWTATDTCGNSSTASQTINVEDKIGPITTTEFNSNVTANCDAIPVKPELVFVDACSAINSTIFTETISNQTTDSYIINRKWSVSDTCVNTSEFVQTVNVTITNSLITLTGSVCNDGETTSIDLTSLFPTGTPTTGTWTDVSNTGKLEGNNFNAATLAVGNYIFEYVINDTNCPRSIRITVTVTTDCGGIVLPCGTIVVHNAFSPDGDGINEKFVIDNINDTNCYPENTVEIYNRWGILVYSTKGYNNTTNAFDGISYGRSTVSQSSGLPAGTYFYILTYTSFDNNNVIQTNKKEGYLFLTK